MWKIWLALLPLAALALGQDRLSSMPRYDRYEKLRRDMAGSIVRGDLQARWADDGKSFTYSKEGKRYRVDAKTGTATEDTGTDSSTGQTGRNPNRRRPERGRQFDTALSADGKMKAVTRDRNVFISDADGKNEKQITTDGGIQNRIKNGEGSWVYGEELGQQEAMWWSPDGKRLAYFRFDESKVPDYYLQMEQVNIQDKLDTEAYPKAGAPNPTVKVQIYDLASRKTITADVAFGDATLAGYVYDIRWSPDGSALWFNRTNRAQNILEWCACDITNGVCRSLYREENPKGWVNNHINITWLEGNKQFLMLSEKSGFNNIYLFDADVKPVRQITNHDFEVNSIVKTDGKTIWYTARDGDTPYRIQLHRVGIDGKGEKRLTDPFFSHSISLAPDGQHFVDIAETLSMPPTTYLRDGNGKEIKKLAESDLTKFDTLSLKKAEQFAFTAADGKTKCYGYLQFPSDFDASKKYPLLVSVYGGPESGMGVERFQPPNAITELGFLHCWIDGRGTSGRGRDFRNSVYQTLGVTEIDDQAAGVKELAKRPYIDGDRVGIYGTSYGGYASLMCLLRYPDVFAAAASSSPVTDWRNYDTIYTERFMNTPQANPTGYENGNAMKYVKNLKGRLLLYWGTADNNVHPSNSLQLIRELSRAGKSFDISVGPDAGHSGVNSTKMWEFFIDNLILKKPDPLKLAWNKRAYRRSLAR